jgi:para-nitrobenzyl esterase
LKPTWLEKSIGYRDAARGQGKLSMRLGALFLLLSIVVHEAAGSALVHTQQGLVQGVERGGLTVYEGLPFAAPPVGPLRWRPPQPPKPWTGVLEANAFKLRCMQVGSSGPGTPDDEPMSEDCLYLNIWSPRQSLDAQPPSQGAREKASAAHLPVMLWIYGGGFQNGAGSYPYQLGDQLARKGVVVVTINYRLGTLGFLALPELTAESGHRASGNYGLMDMIAALQWVKSNIAAFGGDPDNVTIFGVSAGSWAVSMLMAAPLAHGLFQRAIGESGASFKPPNGNRDRPQAKGRLQEAQHYGKTLEAKLGAHSLAELRALPAARVIAAGPAFSIIDGYVRPEQTYAVFAAGRQNDVPLLVGHTSGEGDMTANVGSAQQYVRVVREQAGPLADRLLALFPARTQAEAAKSQRRFETEYSFAWEAWTWGRLQSRTGTSKVFEYDFDHRPPYPDEEPYRSWGVPHMAELFYLFQHYAPDWAWTATDHRVADLMSSYWVNFARSGDPNGPGLPRWQPFDESHQRVMHMGDSFAMSDLPDRPELEVMDDFVRRLRALDAGAASVR